MQTHKPKKKRSPRNRHLLRTSIVIMLLVMLGLIGLPYAETYLTAWLADDPFTPICDADHLEVAFMSDVEGETYLYRMRLNGESPRRVTDLSDPHATSVRWTPDGRYLVFSLMNARQGFLQIVTADTGEITAIELPEHYFEWYILPDSTAVIVWMKYSGDAKFRIALPLTDTTIIEEIDDLPQILFSYNYRVYSLGKSTRIMIDSATSLYSRDTEQAIFSPDGSLIVASGKLRRRAGIYQQHIFVREVESNTMLWDIGDDREDYDVEYIIQDVSLSNDLLYIRQYREIGENSILLDMPDEAFIAHIDEQRIQPILDNLQSKKIRNLTWSPDSNQMFIALLNWQTKMTDIYVANYDGDNQTFVSSIPSDTYSIARYNWTPDEQYLSYVDNNRWIYLLDLETRGKCRVTKGVAGDWGTDYEWRIVPEDER